MNNLKITLIILIGIIILSCKNENKSAYVKQNNSKNIYSDSLKQHIKNDFLIFENHLLSNNIDSAYIYLDPLFFNYFKEMENINESERKKILNESMGFLQEIKNDGFKITFEIIKISDELKYDEYLINKINYKTILTKDTVLIDDKGKSLAIKSNQAKHWRFIEYNENNLDTILLPILPKDKIEELKKL